MRTTEIYYILDKDDSDAENGDGVHGTEDPIVQPNGVVNSLYRETFETLMTDGSIRYDRIVADATLEGGREQYELIDFNGTLNFANANPVRLAGDDLFSPGAVPEQRWSSRVEFAHEPSGVSNWQFWGRVNNLSVIGTRYYSSGMVDGVLHQTYLIKEEGVALNPRWSEDFSSLVDLSRGQGTYFEGVIRVQIIGNNKSIRGRYVITDRRGNFVTININNEQITVGNN